MSAAQDLYPSRVGEQEYITPRREPVVYGHSQPDNPFALSEQQLQAFDRDGFLRLDNYMPEMVQPLTREIDHLKQTLAGCEELYTEPDSNELRTLFKPHEFSELVDTFARHPKILTAVQQILGSEAYVMQSRINIKPAFRGKSFPWHSDFETWHVEDGMPRMRAVTAWIMLNDNSDQNGPLYVLPGSHKHYVSCQGTTNRNNHLQSLKKQIAGVPQPQSISALLEKTGRGVQGIYGSAGTVVLHDCNLMHGSPDNISPWPRSLLMLVYNSVDNRNQRPFSGLPPRPEYLSCRQPRPLQPLKIDAVEKIQGVGKAADRLHVEAPGQIVA